MFPKFINRRSFVFSLTIMSMLALLLIMEMHKILHCEAEETKKYVISPRGDKLQKIGKLYGLKTYSQLSNVCSYNHAGKIECPEVRLYGESVIRQIQLVITRMLLILDQLSRKHNFKYFITSSTLIGAVRSQGFIPWDNDVDIGMLREDYNKFLKVAVADLPEDIFFQNKNTDPFYKIYQKNEAKLRDRNSCYCLCLRYGCKRHDGFMLDIFVLDQTAPGVYENHWKRFKYTREELFPLTELPFEGYKVFVPHMYNEILFKEYGNITNIPPDNKLCPSKGYIGYPWKSCEEISKMSNENKNRIIYDSRISSDWILYYIY